MTTDIVTVGPEVSVHDAMELFADRHISGAPVVSGEKLLGVISATDLMAFAAGLPGAPTGQTDQGEWGEYDVPDEYPNEEEGEESTAYFTDFWADAGADTAVRFAETSGPEWNVLDEYTVSDAMTRLPVWKLPPRTPVPSAAETMRTHGIHRILVTEDDKLLGIVTTTDIANAVAERKLTARTYVFGRAGDFDERGW
jgi:CBS domain-containing protein